MVWKTYELNYLVKLFHHLQCHHSTVAFFMFVTQVECPLSGKRCLKHQYVQYKKKKNAFTLCHNWPVKKERTRDAKRGAEDGDDRLTFDQWWLVPMCTTLPACTDWLIMVQHWCHSSHYTSSSLCFPASSSKLSVKLRLLVMVRKIPIVLFFWQTGRRLFPTVPALVKSCNNAVQHLQHPLQLFSGSLQTEKTTL